MELLLGMLWLAGVAWAAKNALEHASASYRKSRASRPAKQGRGRHAVAWWSREAGKGFPVTRAGFHRGWLAHQTAMEQHRAQREEAKTSHLEARASISAELTEHRRRQAEAQARIDQADGTVSDEVARKRARKDALKEARAALAAHHTDTEDDEYLRLNRAVIDAEQALKSSRRVDGQPETEADTRFFDLRESGYAGPLDRDGNIPDPSDPQTAQALATLAAMRNQTQEGTRMATATDTNYTQSLQMAKEVEAEADAAVNDIRWQQMENQVDAIGALMRGDTATLSDASDVADALREQKKADRKSTRLNSSHQR